MIPVVEVSIPIAEECIIARVRVVLVGFSEGSLHEVVQLIAAVEVAAAVTWALLNALSGDVSVAVLTAVGSMFVVCLLVVAALLFSVVSSIDEVIEDTIEVTAHPTFSVFGVRVMFKASH